MKVIKSVCETNTEALESISNLFLGGKGFDLDPTYSKGNFYKTFPEPKFKSDSVSQFDDVTECDCKNLRHFKCSELNSIIFDPPFMFGKHGKTDQNIMTKRFTMFDSWEQLETMYKSSLKEFYRILKKNGVLAFKCQDYTDSKTTLTHCFVHNWALEIGFKTEDLFIMIFKGGRIWNSNLVQRHARKFHSYWYVFKKK